MLLLFMETEKTEALIIGKDEEFSSEHGEAECLRIGCTGQWAAGY